MLMAPLIEGQVIVVTTDTSFLCLLMHGSTSLSADKAPKAETHGGST
jgi:hypothetical protein